MDVFKTIYLASVSSSYDKWLCWNENKSNNEMPLKILIAFKADKIKK